MVFYIGFFFFFFSSELIRKYKIKCKENENLQEQQRKSSALLKEYQNKLINSLSKQTPLEKVSDVCMTGSVIN
jgi:uncharacterized membrane protein